MSGQGNRIMYGRSWSFAAVALRIMLVFAVTKIEHHSASCFSPSPPRGTRIRQTSGMVATKPKKKKSSKKKSRVRDPILAEFDSWAAAASDESNPRSPIPSMPSPLFSSLAQSQLELLANSLSLQTSSPESSTGSSSSSESKIKSMALYLPQENVKTGQLEFLPAVLYPPPSSDRVFLASEAGSGVAPSLPKILTKLPGFAHATSLIPGYPMVSSSSNEEDAGSIGVAEEVMCDPITKNTALSVPLFFGSQTVGVLLVWPSVHAKREGASVWTEQDRQQVSRAAQSLSLALSMDKERSALQEQTDYFRETLSNSLHQVKNPLQALRTYGKLLQQRIANSEDEVAGRAPKSLLHLAQQLSVQSDRVVDLLLPMDDLVDGGPPLYLLNPSEPQYHALTKWQGNNETAITTDGWANQTEEFSNSKERHSIPKQDASADSSRRQPNTNSAKQEEAATPWSSTTTSSSSSAVEVEMSFIPDVLEPILSGFEVIASERGIDFQVVQQNDELPGVTVSPTCLQEAVSNVIDNAFKYAVLPKPDSGFTRNPSPRVCVRLSANEKPLAPGVTILVQDNGPGIRKEELEDVFQRGFRSESTSAVEGSGIGLDISRSLISRMGGLIEVAQGDDNEASSLDGAAMKLVFFSQSKPTITLD